MPTARSARDMASHTGTLMDTLMTMDTAIAIVTAIVTTTMVTVTAILTAMVTAMVTGTGTAITIAMFSTIKILANFKLTAVTKSYKLMSTGTITVTSMWKTSR